VASIVPIGEASVWMAENLFLCSGWKATSGSCDPMIYAGAVASPPRNLRDSMNG